MTIPNEFYTKLNQQIDISTVFLLENLIILEDSTLNRILETEDVSVIVQMLKIKLILIHKNQSDTTDFDICKLLSKLRRGENTNLIDLHDALFYALLIQKTINNAKQLLEESYNFLSTDEPNDLFSYHWEVIDVILEVCVLTKNNDLIENKIGQIIRKSLFIENKIVQKKIIRNIISNYVSITNDQNLFLEIWHEIKMKHTFDLSILIALENFYFPLNCEFNILGENVFWLNLQNSLNSDNPIIKKQAIYLLKKIVDNIFTNETNYMKFKTILSNMDIINEHTNFDEYKNAWKNFLILCDVSNEKQLHLIKPTFKLYSTLNVLHDNWKNCITKLFISHPHSAVVKHAIIQILSSNWTCNIDVLIRGLDNNFLYEDTQESSISDYLITYISKLKSQEIAQFLNLLCEFQPSPVPFYHISKSIKNIQLNKSDLKILNNLIHVAIKVPHLYIRKGILDNLFHFFICSDVFSQDMDENLLNELLEIIYLFAQINYLQRGNNEWKKILKSFDTAKLQIEKHIIIKISDNDNDLFSGNYTIKYAIFIVLLIDANILPSNWVQDNLVKLLSILNETSNCETKLNYLEFLFHILPTQKLLIKEQHIVDLLNNIYTICNSDIIYSKDFFNKIEFIFNELLSQTNITLAVLLLFSKILEDWCTSKKYIICNIMICKKLVEMYDNKKLVEMYDNKKILVDNLNKLDMGLKWTKQNFLDEINENSCVKVIILSNYYYIKLKICKIRFRQIEADENILRKMNKYYDKGGSDILIQIVETLFAILTSRSFSLMPVSFFDEYYQFLQRCQTDIFHMRTNDLFKKFIRLIMHPKLKSVAIFQDFIENFCRQMFEPTQNISGLRNDILRYLQNSLTNNEMNINILIEALLYGPVLRKDQRIEFETCEEISRNQYDSDLINPFTLEKQVRSQAICIVLSAPCKLKTADLTQFYENMLQLLKTKYDKYAGKRYFGDSQIHLLKLRILQALHILINRINKNQLQILTEWLFDCLTNESQQLSIKLLIQWLLVRICVKENYEEKVIVELMEKTKRLKGTACTAVFPIFYHLIKEKKITESLVSKCIDYLLPYVMGQHFTIRYIAQVTIIKIHDVYIDDNNIVQSYNSLYRTINNVLEETVTDKSFEIELMFTKLLPSLQTIYFDIPRLTNVTSTEWLRPDYFHCVTTMTIQSDEDRLSDLQYQKKRTQETTLDNIENTNVQMKIEPISNCPFDEAIYQASGNLIVVASLIDRLPNLGGLSRTCEVFGVKQYVVNNIQFTKMKEFQCLSMSSEKWVDTIEVKFDDLPKYLNEMRRKRYMIIGAEQTADSKSLTDFRFEKNTVLLLGNEKEGIPANLIHLLDECIEIPQFGQIRSLNVHVAGALFMWEYIKQNYETK